MQPAAWPEPDPQIAAAIAAKYRGRRPRPLAVQIRDRLGQWLDDEIFAAAFGTRGRPGWSPSRLALVTVLQRAENLPDRQAAEAVRTRIDWQYLLGLPLDDPGFDPTVLAEFRTRVADAGLEQVALGALLERLAADGLVKAGGKQRTDSTHVVAAVAALNRLELAGESVRAVLEALAAAHPDWLGQRICVSDFARRYGTPMTSWHPPASQVKRDELAIAYARDGYALLEAVYDSSSPAWLREIPAADVLRRVLVQNYTRTITGGKEVIKRREKEPEGEPNLYPADARQVLPGDPYSLGMRSLAAFHLAAGGFGQAQEVIAARTGVTVGRAQLAGLAEDLAAWTDDFYQERSRDAEEEEDQPDSDVIMMQGDGKGIAMRPEHRRNAGKETGSTHPGIKKMAEIVAVADFTPAAREPQDIAAPPARRQAHPGPKARDKWVSASVTESIEDMIASAFEEADRRDPQRARQRVFLVDGNKQQITAIGDHAKERGLKVPILIDYIHVSGYIGKAAAALHPGDPAAAGQWADGQLLRVLHGRAKAAAATLASVAAKTRASARTRHLDLTDMDRAVTYLTNNHQHMKYDKALEKGWPIATGMIEGACRFVIEDRFGITGARWSPDGAEVILKIRAVVVNGDLDDYMNYYKQRYRDEHHLARYDEDTIDRLNLAA